MLIYLIDEFFRVDAMTGGLIEKEFESAFKKNYECIRLMCCRNEYVSFQVIFDTEGERIGNADISFSDLSNKEGKDICASEYSVFVEWFHQAEGKYVPDALIPLGLNGIGLKIPLDEKYLPGQRAGALWVDLFIPGDTLDGSYEGEITVVAGKAVKKFNISVKVYDVLLTDESRIFPDMNSYADSISPGFPCLAGNPGKYDDGSFFKVEREFYRMSYEHRCVFHNLGYEHSGRVIPSFAPELEGEGKNIRVKSWENFDRHFGPLLDGSAFEGLKRPQRPIPFMYLPFNFAWPACYEKWKKKGYKTEYRRILKEFITHFEEKGWVNTCFELFLNHKKRYRYFPYDGDETRFLEDEEILDIFNDMNSEIIDDTKVKAVFRMDSSWAYGLHFNSRFSDFIKMWVVNGTIFRWLPESVPYMKEKGDILWNYGGINNVYDNHISLAIWPFRCIMTGITGVTFWNSTGFGDDYLKTPLDSGRQAVMYPGVPFGYDGPIPSIRLKVLRNATQTADLVMMYEGSKIMKELKDIINLHFELDFNDWWDRKPGFINEPPCTWTNAKLSVAKSAYVKDSMSPVLLGGIKKDVLIAAERWVKNG